MFNSSKKEAPNVLAMSNVSLAMLPSVPSSVGSESFLYTKDLEIAYIITLVDLSNVKYLLHDSRLFVLTGDKFIEDIIYVY